MTSRKETRKTGGFRAKGSDDQTYQVNEYTEFIIVTSLSGAKEELAGLQSYRLSTGGAVNYKSSSEFTIVATGVRLTKL